MRIYRVSASAIHSALIALSCCFVSALPLSAQKPATSTPVPSDVVELPALTVTDTRELPEPEKWSYTKIPNFEVISSAGERTTKRLARDFDIFTMAVGIAWPIKTRPMPPSALILCNNVRQFEGFLPPKESTAKENRMSATLNDRERAFIVLNLGTNSITLDPALADVDMSTTSSVSFDVDHYKQLYREYVRYLFSQAETPPAPWFEEGVCQILMSMEVYKRLVIIGQVDSVFSQEVNPADQVGPVDESDTAPETTTMGDARVADVDFNIALRRRALLSFEDFFGVARDSAIALNTVGNSTWAKQCYAFVHMCRFGRRGIYKEAFAKFSERTAKEPATEAMFQECFGKPYKKFLIELRGYIQAADYKYDEFNITGAQTLDTPLPELRAATEGEAARIKGDAYRAAGKAAEARNTLAAAYVRGERDPVFLATLGQAEMAFGNAERARKFLEASAGKSDRPSVYIDLAKLRLDDAIANPAGADKKISDGQLVSVLNPLLVTRSRPPVSPRVYELIAAAWLVAEKKPKPEENLIVLTEGLKTYPRHPGLFYNAAALYAHIGNVPVARALIAQGLKVSTEPSDLARFNELKAKLPAAAPTAAPAAATSGS
jgi:hypothetical protein